MDALDILNIALLRSLDASGLEQQIFFYLDDEFHDAAFTCEAILATMQQAVQSDEAAYHEACLCDDASCDEDASDSFWHDDFVLMQDETDDCFFDEGFAVEGQGSQKELQKETHDETPHWYH